jgi:peptide/nickel transport system substrate-binding protein
MSKYRFSILLVLAGLATVALAACAPAAAPPPAPQPTSAPQATAAPPPTSAPQPTTAPAPTAVPQPTAAPSGAANTLVFAADISDMISLDPAVSYEFSGDLLVHQAYETLVKFEGADLSTIKPSLASKWDIKDAGDHWELTFTLRDGAKFATGNPVTADDVVFSFQRVLSLNKSPAFLFSDIAQMKPDGVKAVDPKTVLISLPKTASPQGFLSILTFTVGSVVDSKEVKTHVSGNDFGSAWLLDKSAGSGPYVIDHWQKEVEVLLKANPTAATKPVVSNALVKHVPDANNQQSGLQKGDFDIARNLSPEQIAAIKGKPGVTTATGDSLLLIYVGMNATVKPLDNPDVREALRMAVDYDGIIKSLLSGNAKKVQAIIPSGLAGFNPDAPFQQNIDAAKKLLTKAGQDKGFTLELLVPTGQAPGGAAWADLAAKLQADLAKINVTLNIKQTTQAELLGSYRAQKGQLVMILWGPDFPDPDANVGPFTDYAAKSISYRNAWDDKTIAQKARDAALITDPAKRAAAYKDITDSVLHNGPYIILYQPIENFGLRSNVKGFVWSSIGWTDFWTISK